MTEPNEAKMPHRATDTDGNQYYSLDRRIPVWGIITVAVSIFSAGVVCSYSFYASNVRMAEAVDRLGSAVERLQSSQIAANIKDVQHDAQIAENTKAIAKLDAAVELLKTNHRWTPK